MNTSAYKPGMYRPVFEDPINREKLECMAAKLLSFIRHGGDNLEYWNVQFPDGDVAQRFV